MEISEQAKKAAAWIVAFLRNNPYRPDYPMVEGNIQEAINQSLQEKDAEIGELKEDSDQLEKLTRYIDEKLHVKGSHSVYEDIDYIITERDTLRSQLEQMKKYASHLISCHWDWNVPDNKCTCGLTDLLKGVE